ncbi:sugar ABC transporter ATP-binding protein [Akkermansiaceae bacterium]|nr:sugar ABC transporter ATP-binding protein [Akkermansiaceae bacterium]HAE18608.1 D-xylose ABC transporter ATP-binding protein [Verrucomicrobiales bacterium]|tara:strand:+ start:199 stop:1704 length:1506 start_codon:yes stop_codon:yes gene_type:complete
MGEPFLEVQKITKRFPGVVALSGVDLQVYPAEILALIGENGAGKSTLMKILAGVQAADDGELLVEGKAVRFSGVQDAQKSGIALIHQELNLAENLTVAANMFLGREPEKFGWIDQGVIQRESKRVLEMVGLEVSPETLLSELTLGKQQLVEIAKALSTDAKVIIMDEPTSSLSLRESERLFEVIHDLREKGVSVIYISHRLGEVKALADRVVVFRDGENAGILERNEVDHDAMVRMMVGRDVSQFYQRTEHDLGEVVLSVRGLRSVEHRENELNFEVRAGEVVGVAGLVGAGRSEMLAALFGARPALGGDVSVAGQSGLPQSPRESLSRGLALVPEDRKGQGLILDMAVKENISLASLRRDSKGPFLNTSKEEELVAEMTSALSVKTPGSWQLARFLSGGNQQKIVLAKWLALKPKVLLLDEPTRGIDIGAKEEIYLLMEKFAREGMAVLFVSSEMEEIMGMADRTLVMHEGRITGELAREDFSEEAIMELATGGNINKEE